MAKKIKLFSDEAVYVLKLKFQIVLNTKMNWDKLKQLSLPDQS